MKVSLISTVKNEERNIKRFLDSVVQQTKKPDEFVIVDGGSTDGTYKILEEYSKKYDWIKNYNLTDANIAEGRNFAIRKTEGDIIFTSDSSTVFEKDWIKKILKGFKKNADIVFGKYHSSPKTIIEKFLVSRLPEWDKVDLDTFIPSNRHTAFRREVWEKLGGFPENLRRADDSWFHKKAHERCFKYAFVKDAEVEWIFDRNLKNMLRLAFLDSKTEGFSFLFVDRKVYFIELALLLVLITISFLGILINKVILVYSLIILTPLLFAYGFKIYKRTKSINVAFVGVFLTILLYFAHVFGVITGIIQRSYKKKE